MKNKIFLLLSIVFTTTIAQQKEFVVDWSGHIAVNETNYLADIPFFEGENFNYDSVNGLRFTSQWVENYNVIASSVELVNVSYSPITTAELKDLPRDLIPNSPKLNIYTSTSREKTFTNLSIYPIIKSNNGSYKKIDRFTVRYRTNNFFANRSFQNDQNLVNSVLNNGEWYRFYVDTTGVYKITKNFIEGLGANLNNVDPRTIKVYGNGGRMIPYSNAADYPIDTMENAVKFVGEEDGVFNDSDYILLYAQGPNGYDEEKRTNINCYNEKTYYYINISSGNGKRIQPLVQPQGDTDLNINTHNVYVYHELDEYNLEKLGRRWLGDKFDIENTKTFEFDIPNLETGKEVLIKVHAAAASPIPTSMNVLVNNNSIGAVSFSTPSLGSGASGGFFFQPITVQSGSLSVSLNYNNSGNPGAIGYLDYISLEAERELRFYGEQFSFTNNEASTISGVGQYDLLDSDNVSEVWDVTDIYNISNILNSNSSDTFSFRDVIGAKKTYVAVTPNDYYSPLKDNITQIENQDIKGTIFLNDQGEFEDIDYIIVTSNELLPQANRLAQINRIQNGLNVRVLGVNNIYNEFSSGNNDIGAIRNLVRYVYNNASTPENRIKYLCLFGDSSYDYKDRISGNNNIVPSWYSYESFSHTSSYVSDDFYGLMDDDEGNIDVLGGGSLDVAVGRIIADTPELAKNIVDKIEKYYSEQSYGNWRNIFVGISDDIDKPGEEILELTTDEICDEISEAKPFVNVTKIHSDSYQQESSSGGDRYPKTREAFLGAIEKGALVINYFGHGGEDGLAHERIFYKSDAESLNNTCKFFCFVTVTCEFTRFDNPLRDTAGEETFWNKDGGAISLISTTREIFIGAGVSFNKGLSKYLYSYVEDDDYEDYEYPSIAEALRLNKVHTPNVNQKRMIFFFGDPAMKLAIPKANIRLTKINDIPISQATDTLKALSYVKLSGEVTDPLGNALNGYNGTLSTTIYDKEIQRETLDNDGNNFVMQFKTLGETIFRGQASVVNGQFELDFIVPRDIGVPVGNGKVSFYAKSTSPLQDQSGASMNTVKIGGINENAEDDNVGPVIQLFMNDESFVSGGVVNQSPTLLAKLEDEHGINTSSGIGHDIIAIIDGDETNPIILNDYYETEVDSYQKGLVSFPFRDLEPGLHTLNLKAWDVYNNSAEQEIQFTVYNENEKLVVTNVLNYPNPFVDYTEFWFNHNSSTPLDVSIQIFTVSGKLVRTLNGQTNSGDCCNQGGASLSRDIIWDGRDDFGDRIGKGVYIYKLTVQSPALNKRVEKIEKLVIL